MNENLLLNVPANLPENVKAHLPQAQQNAERNALWLTEHKTKDYEVINKHFSELLRGPNTQANRITRLRYISHLWSKTVTTASACKKGCSHCCHISVLMPKAEAKLIAKHTGKKLNPNTKGVPLGEQVDLMRYTGTPCPFLKDNACSIYDHRPFVCRTLVNLDDSDLLCQLVPGANVPVPYANASKQQELFVILTQDEPYADIREWFA